MIKIADVSHVMYQVPDLDVQETFMTDFGLVRVERTDSRLVMRAAGSAPYCYIAEKAAAPAVRGFAFRVGSHEELEQAARMQGASAVEPTGLPGGGSKVTVKDPNGFSIDLVHGIAQAAPLPMRRPMRCNFGDEKQRYGGLQRLDKGPTQVQRLGHVLIFVDDVQGTIDWFRGNFGFIPSDIIYEGEQQNGLGAFLRCDRGDQWTDHHTLGVFKRPPGIPTKLHHASFEIQDFDAQFMGSEYLASKNYKREWGIGRHLLGSQIFDYWRDPNGNLVEHFTDGDLLRNDVPTGFHPAGPDSLYQWGPPVSEGFFT
jgi:catechol 2,3-dioxygenase-like lactoylglutathione lyase family enzyme